MGNRDNQPGDERPVGGARAYRRTERSGEDGPKQGERGVSSVAMRARKGKGKKERESKREPSEKEEPASGEKPEQAAKETEGEQTMRKGIYLSALIWVEGDWPAASDFASPAKAAAKDALSKALEGEHDGLTMRLKGLEVRNDVEEDNGEGGEAAGKPKEEKFEF
jgi:hypothetical protein